MMIMAIIMMNYEGDYDYNYDQGNYDNNHDHDDNNYDEGGGNVLIYQPRCPAAEAIRQGTRPGR